MRPRPRCSPPIHVLLVAASLGLTPNSACRVEGETEADDDSGPVPADDDTSPSPCADGPTAATLLQGDPPLVAPHRVWSGVAVQVSVATGPWEDLSYRWQVSAGSLDDPTAASPWWTPPDDFPRNEAESTVEVTVSHPCAEATAEASVRVIRRDAERVVLVVNSDVPEGWEVAEAYAAARGVPEENLLAVAAGPSTQITLEEYRERVRTPLKEALESTGLDQRVTYLVTVYGMPYHLEGLEAPPGYDVSWGWWPVSLDSMLGTLFTNDSPVATYGLVANPLYLAGDSRKQVYTPPLRALEAVDAAERAFIPVARLDGPTVEDALALVERALEGEDLARTGSLAGTAYVDRQYPDDPATDDFGSYESVEWALKASADLLAADGWQVVLDTHAEEFGTAPAPTECPEALWYSGWYSYNNYPACFQWAPGSIGIHFDSCSACSMKSGTSFAVNAVLGGITATMGAVNEPFVFGLPDMDQFWFNLGEGNNLAEAAWQATYYVRWMTTVIGDPLYCPVDPDRAP